VSHGQGFSQLQVLAGHLAQQALGWQQMQSGHLQALPHEQASPHGQGQAAFFTAVHCPAPTGPAVQLARGLQQAQSGHLQAASHGQAVSQRHWQTALSAASHRHEASHLHAGWQGQDFKASASAAAPNNDATTIKCANIDTSP